MPLAARSLAVAYTVVASLAIRAETEVELRTRVISQLRLVHVPSPPMPRSQFIRDEDPKSIEIVRTNERGEAGSVSEDGQVIYLQLSYNSKSEEKLVERAFEILFRQARAGQPNPSLERP